MMEALKLTCPYCGTEFERIRDEDATRTEGPCPECGRRVGSVLRSRMVDVSLHGVSVGLQTVTETVSVRMEAAARVRDAYWKACECGAGSRTFEADADSLLSVLESARKTVNAVRRQTKKGDGRAAWDLVRAAATLIRMAEQMEPWQMVQEQGQPKPQTLAKVLPPAITRLSDCFLCQGTVEEHCRFCPTRPYEEAQVVGMPLTDRQQEIINANKFMTGTMSLEDAKAVRDVVQDAAYGKKAWRIVRNVFQQVRNQREDYEHRYGWRAPEDAAWLLTKAQQTDLERAVALLETTQ